MATGDGGNGPVELLQELIRFNTSNPPGNEADCIAYVDNLLTRAGVETKIVAKSAERPNLIARLPGSGASPPLLLEGHVDVVGAEESDWTHPPFEAVLKDGFVWGRGALDMKGGVAMMLSAVLRAKAEGLEPAGDVVLAVLCDEEAGSDNGAAFLVAEHPELFEGIRYALGEFGAFSTYFAGRRLYPIQVAEKQLCWMKATLSGAGGHPSVPVRDGAAGELGRLLVALERKRLPVHVTPVVRRMLETVAEEVSAPAALAIRGLLHPRIADRMLRVMGPNGSRLDAMLHNTVAATVVHGGEKVNVLPQEFQLELDARLLPGFRPNDVICELRQLVDVPLDIEVDRYDGGPAEPDLGLFDTLRDVLCDADPGGTPIPILLPASTDGRFFSRLGIQTYGFLPMPLTPDIELNRLIHNADERIPADAVEFGSRCMYEVLRRFSY